MFEAGGAIAGSSPRTPARCSSRRAGSTPALGYQAFAEDVQVHGVTRQAADAWLVVFPRAHVEVMASGRAQRIGPTEHAYLALLQLHYSL